MKKIGKKICNFTKVFLVFCLLFSNLSSLKIVFAYEGEDLIVSENKDEVLEEENKEEILVDEEEKEEVLEDAISNEENLENDIEEEPKEEVLEEEIKEEILEEETKEEKIDEEENKEEETLEEVKEDETEEIPTEGETAPEENEEQVITNDFTTSLNDSASLLGFAGNYLFTDKDDGKLYVVPSVNEAELESIVSNAYDDGTVSVEGDMVTVSTNGDSVTYQMVIYDADYLERLMKVAVGDGEATEDDDINGDGKVDAYDAATLRMMLDYGFGSEVFNEDVKIDAKLDGVTDSLTVGDTFKIIYIMTLADYGVNGITGSINYNKDMLTLDKVDVKNFVDGANYDGKFLYFGDYIMGEEVVTVDSETGEEVVTYSPKDYIIVEMTFTAIAGGSDAVTVSDIGYFNDVVYYSGNETLSKDVIVLSNDNTLSSITIGGVSVPIDRLTDVYTITVPNDVTSASLSYVLSDLSASVTSIVAPEELAVGENTVTITVVAENGEERTYVITVIREGKEEEEEEETQEVVNPVNYEDDYTYDDSDDKKEEITTDGAEEPEEEKKDEGKLSRAIIIILILLAIAGLIYLIFKDDDDDETKKVNRDINRFKKEDLDEGKTNKTSNNKKTKKKGR